MKHIDDDTILKYVLETLDDDELKLIEDHFDECDYCSNKLIESRKEIEIMSSFDPELEVTSIQIPKAEESFASLMKWVAVLLIGFIAGYTTSAVIPENKTTIVEQHLITETPEISEVQFISCSNVDLW